jgi:hypothetical protein
MKTMRKKDPIFWIATAIFVIAFGLAIITKTDSWFFLMIISYLLRPTLASLGVGRRYVDERQMSIQYRSGNIAFVVMLAAAIFFAVDLKIKGDHNWEWFNTVIILGLATKALFNVLLVKNYREAAARIIMSVGLLVTLFVAAENGATLGGLIESTPWLLIVGIGWLSRRYPRTIGTAMFVIATLLLVVILAKGLRIGQFITALLICVPLVLAGVCLFVGDRSGADPVPDLT